MTDLYMKYLETLKILNYFVLLTYVYTVSFDVKQDTIICAASVTCTDINAVQEHCTEHIQYAVHLLYTNSPQTPNIQLILKFML